MFIFSRAKVNWLLSFYHFCILRFYHFINFAFYHFCTFTFLHVKNSQACFAIIRDSITIIYNRSAVIPDSLAVISHNNKDPIFAFLHVKNSSLTTLKK